MCTIYDAEKKLWTNPNSRLLSHLCEKHGHWILERLSSHGSKVAQITADSGHQMTFNEMRLETIRVAQNLQKRGFKPRQVFGFMAGNSEHLVPVFLASICLACPVVSLHPMLSKDEIIRILEKTKPTVVFCDANAYNEMNEALKELKWDVKVFTFGGKINCVESVESLLNGTGVESSFRPVDYNMESDVALMSCSSGTTGPSKCACLSYGYSYITPSIFNSDSVIFSDESIYWTIGMKPIVDSIYNGVTRIITTRSFSPELHLKLIEQYKITVLYISTFSLILCLKNEKIDRTNLSSMKTIIFYGAKWPSSLGSTLKRYFPNTDCASWYGSTEIGVTTETNFDKNGNMSGAKLLENCQAKIVDECGNRCGPGINGEICFKVENAFLGYLEDPEANASTVDDEGFFRIGDVGHFDNDGNLVIEDRKKNVINVFYFDSVILPSEMEDCLVAMPDINEACVVGVPVVSGETLPAAVIVPKPGSKLTARDIYNVIAEKFPNRSRLRGGVYFVDSLSKTHNGKLVRKKITELANEMFKSAKEYDQDTQDYLRDIPEEFRKMI